MKRNEIYYLAGVAVIALYIWTIVMGNDPLQPAIASKILRFHVLANSDAEYDQSVKEEVRDAVGVYLQPLLEDAESLEETKQIVEKNMDTVIETAKSTLRLHGYDYDVTACIANVDFPEKSYGSYTFPKGKYEALQIVIGEGKGQNWWCVLYPNMCFKGSVFEVVEEEAEESLKEVLNPWEYADVFDSGKVEFRFKFLEYFKERG
ncbi:MAG: stage II sporulation protein R [Agathobacter sp.]|nr:stage II sporulation protein R [Agathobacter sp.]